MTNGFFEESYDWDNDIMEITQKFVYEMDEARISNIADHFKIDLSEIRKYIEMKNRQQSKSVTNADRFRGMTDEELAEFFGTLPCCPPGTDLNELCYPSDSCEGADLQVKCWLKWLKQEAVECSEN